MTGSTPVEQDYFTANRANWNDRAAIHMRDPGDIYRFDLLRAGTDVLTPIEQAEIGDLDGLKALHLQCHIGTDTICLARRGAQVSGLDFSPVALGLGRELAEECGQTIRFVEGNVYDAPALAGDDYDFVFTSWGTIGWLPDIKRWAAAAGACLKPGGTLYIADGHPTLHLLEEREGQLVVAYDWRTPATAPIIVDSDETYAGDGAPVANVRNYEWNHSLSDLFAGLGEANLRLEFFHEHDRIPWKAFSSMVRDSDGMFRQASGQHSIPLAFSLRATKSA